MIRNDTIDRLGCRMLTLAFAITCGAMATGTAVAQPTLRGKTVTIYAGGGVGGGVDIFARVLAPHLSRHLPGHPNVLVSNMPGAGGMQAVQYVYNVAPKDGTAIGTTNVSPIHEGVLGTSKVDYDIGKFGWIGSLAQGDTVCAFWHESPVHTLADLRSKGATIGATGVRSAATAVSLLLNSILDTRLKPIAGFKGSGGVVLAMERKEVDGSCVTLNSIRATKPDWLRDNKIRILLNVAMVPDPEYPDVPMAIKLATSPVARQMLELYLAPYQVQNPFMLPPGANKEMLGAFRQAFEATIEDKAYLSDAKNKNQVVVPKTGDVVEATLKKMMSAPSEVLSKLKTTIAVMPK